MSLRTITVAASILFGVHASASASIVTQWNFNQYATSGALNAPLASIGSGSASGVDLSGSLPLTGSISNIGSGNQSSDPVQPGTAWNSTNYAAQGTKNGMTGVQFNTSTAGVTDGLVISFDVRGSNTASRFIRLLYSTDGTTFTSAGLANGGLHEITGGQVFNNGVTFDLTSIVAARNNNAFAFRIVTAFAPGMNQYKAITDGSSYGTGGTLRYDMVTVAIPAPGAAALLGMAALMARPRRRSTTRRERCVHAPPSRGGHPRPSGASIAHRPLPVA